MRKQGFTTKIYPFILEGLLLYFLYVPLFLYTQSLPFWEYLLLLLSAPLLYFLLKRYIKTHMMVLLFVPGLVDASTTFFQFSIIAAIAIALFFYWRLIAHDEAVDEQHDFTILTYTLGLIFIDIIFFYDDKVIWMGIITIMVFICGYWWRHLHFQQRKMEGADLFGIALFLSVFFCLGLIFWGLFPLVSWTLSTLWLVITQSIIYLIGSLLYLSGFRQSDISINSSRSIDIDSAFNGLPFTGEKPSGQVTNTVSNASIGWEVTGGVLLLLFLLLLAFFLYKKKLPSQEEEVSLDKKDLDTIDYGDFKKKTRLSKRKQFSKPTLFVRKKVFEIETLALQQGIGRKPWETLQDWLRRMGMRENAIYLYEKVRYGEKDLSDQETEVFKKEIKLLQQHVNQWKSQSK
ncbi:DUF4129 domain-containing protein [Aquibacillus sp. 3ASR75-11]|uniref:DUF4129 domain-containing protein n=1 Tax=Terrihalobacillus insolitus TaxID=2950438 RepID=A0A9X3WS26_9BACI|nr:DUF4129 domain-containing protein [Terrihalobacillus insolitus]MDC3412888.1 DUF4129 domain-containing protein [Terrihalobacillus insolitus]MDC3423633.1 DUF4129 domain-containing protein [Terrihalobacillus insolitus]